MVNKLLVAHERDSDTADDEGSLIDRAAEFAHDLPRSLLRDLIVFRRTAHPSAAMVLSGLPLGSIPDTPSAELPASDCSPVATRAIQALIGAVLGEQVGYFEESSGGLFQHIYPRKRSQDAQESGSSSTGLLPHTETVFHPTPPDYLTLFCLRGDRSRKARTTLLSVARLLPALSPATRHNLLRAEFRTGVDASFGGGQLDGPPVPVLYGNPLDPMLSYDSDLMTGTTDRAQRALTELRGVTRDLQWPVPLEAGDLMIVSNRLAVHGRTPFPAHYDGQDRWLQRTFLVKDLAASAALRLPASRIIRVRPLLTMAG